jgi:hypothetical protein
MRLYKQREDDINSEFALPCLAALLAPSIVNASVPLSLLFLYVLKKS